MKRCSICKKNLAVIFTTKVEGGKTETQGFALIVPKRWVFQWSDQLVQQRDNSRGVRKI